MMKTYRLIKEENNVRNRNYIRIKEGIKKINRKKILILIPIMYFLIIGCLTYAGEWLLGKMGSPFSTELYLVIFYALMIVLLSAGMIGILCMLGTPIKSKKIEGQLIDIGFTDKEGNAPILLSKEKDKKGIKFEFYSPKISFVKYEDHISDIETALNIKVVDIRPGKDIQHVVIRSIQSGKENKDMLLWKDEYLSDKDFEFVLGESYFGSESINISGTPHILIGGASGSGKSKLLKSILMQAKKKEASLVFICSHGGNTKETVEAAHLAKDLGAAVVAMTHTPGSACDDSSLNPIVYSWEDDTNEKDKPQGIVLNILNELMKAQEPDYKLYDAVADGLEKADGIVRAAVKSVKNRTWLFAEKYAKEPFLYIMGSGAAYASAYGFAICSLQEMQWMDCCYLNSAEYFHGPFEVTDEDHLYILLKSRGRNRVMDERAEVFLNKYAKKYEVIDANDLGLDAIDDSCVEYFNAMVFYAMSVAYRNALQDKRCHPTDMRRYMGVVEY